MLGIVAITIAAGLFLLRHLLHRVGEAWFEVGSPGWWVLTAMLHLPFFGILFFLIIGIGERLGFYWKGRAPEQPGRLPAVYPTVCVQLPMFNEHAVARRVIEAAANMHWPADRFSIQVLDDSTDEDTRRLVEQVSAGPGRGGAIAVLHRADRRGYKASMPSGGTPADEPSSWSSSTQILCRRRTSTADHSTLLPTKRSTGHRPGAGPGAGHLNHNESMLTRSKSLWVDDHHTANGLAVSRWFVNFTGTAGVAGLGD
jgi:hypothetical protein